METFGNHKGEITCMSFSPDGELLAVGDSNAKIIIYDFKTKQVKINQFVFHSGRINSLDWSPSGLFLVSASLDTNIEIWSIQNPTKHISIKTAHLNGVNGVIFLDEETIASCGADASIKIYSFKA